VSRQTHTQRNQLLLPALLLMLALLLAGFARDSLADGRDILREAALPTLGGSPIRVMLIRGVVEPIEKDLFGRPERVAITFVNSHGVLIQNPIEDAAAGEKLKDHVGEDVTVRGALMVKADGRPALLIDGFEVNGSPGEGSRH
jgi:hypothetical protein